MSKKMGKKASNVDYRLLYKRKIVNFLETIKDNEQTVSQMNESMKKLFNMGEYVIPVCISKLKEDDDILAPVICYALEFANNYDVINPLLDILKMPNISDKVKAGIITVLSYYGIDARELPLDTIIKDFDKIAIESLENIFDDINEDYFLIPYILDDLEGFSTEMKVLYVRDIGNLRNEKSIELLEILAMTDDVSVVQEAARALGKIRTSKSLDTLIRVSNFIEDENVKDIVLREARRLRFCGIIPEVNKPNVELGEPVKLIITSIDGLGNRALWFAWKNPIKEDTLVTMNLLLNSETGVSDCWCISQLDIENFNLYVEDLAKTTVVAECDLDYALYILKDALCYNYEKQVELPYQFHYWRYLLTQKYDMQPQNYKPILNDLNTSSDKVDIKRTFELFNYNIFQDWFISDPRVYDYADVSKSKYGFTLKKMPYKKVQHILSNFIKELIEPRADIIKRKLELTADFVLKLGQYEIAQLILVAAQSMEEKPLCNNPFIQRMVLESLKVALSNMKNGFDMRKTPEVFDEF